MSANALVTVMCDAPNCGYWNHAGVADTAKEARRQLRGAGWRVAVSDPDGRRTLDYCPLHAAGQR